MGYKSELHPAITCKVVQQKVGHDLVQYLDIPELYWITKNGQRFGVYPDFIACGDDCSDISSKIRKYIYYFIPSNYITDYGGYTIHYTYYDSDGKIIRTDMDTTHVTREPYFLTHVYSSDEQYGCQYIEGGN